MKRNQFIAVLIVGFSLALVLFVTPRGQAEKTKHSANSIAGGSNRMHFQALYI